MRSIMTNMTTPTSMTLWTNMTYRETYPWNVCHIYVVYMTKYGTDFTASILATLWFVILSHLS